MIPGLTGSQSMAVVESTFREEAEPHFKRMLDTHYRYCKKYEPFSRCYADHTKRRVSLQEVFAKTVLAVSSSWCVFYQGNTVLSKHLQNGTVSELKSLSIDYYNYPEIIGDRIFTYFSPKEDRRIFVDLTRAESKSSFINAITFFNAHFIFVETYPKENRTDVTSTLYSKDMRVMWMFPKRNCHPEEESRLVDDKLFVAIDKALYLYTQNSPPTFQMNLPCSLSLEHPYSLFSSRGEEESKEMLLQFKNPTLQELLKETEGYILFREGDILCYSRPGRDFYSYTEIKNPIHAFVLRGDLFVFTENSICRFDLIECTKPDFFPAVLDETPFTIRQYHSHNDLVAFIETKEHGNVFWNLSENKIERQVP